MSYVLSYVQPVKDPRDSPYQHIGKASFKNIVLLVALIFFSCLHTSCRGMCHHVVSWCTNNFFRYFFLTLSSSFGNFSRFFFVVPGFIRPLADGSVSVDREDKSQQFYTSIFEYIEAMKKSGIIKDPYLDEVESNYASSPAVYQRSPPVEHAPPSPIPVHQMPTTSDNNNHNNLSRTNSSSSTGSRK